jgi:hypothetical protein
MHSGMSIAKAQETPGRVLLDALLAGRARSRICLGAGPITAPRSSVKLGLRGAKAAQHRGGRYRKFRRRRKFRQKFLCMNRHGSGLRSEACFIVRAALIDSLRATLACRRA